MIVPDQKVKVKWYGSNIKIYKSKGYEYTKLGDEFFIDINDLPRGSREEIKCKCDYCNEIFLREAQIAFKSKNHFCGNKCRIAFLNKFGAHNNTSEIYQCDNCKVEMKVKQYVLKELKTGKRKNIFCSKNCKAKWQSKNVAGKNNPNYNRIEKNCKFCNKTYSVPVSQKNRSKYCSMECRQKGSRNRVKFQCLNCEKDIFKTPTDIKKNKTGKFFCSHKCSNEYIVKTNTEKRLCEYCNKEYETKKSSSQRFCSIKCQSKWQSEFLVGENANNFNKEIPLINRYVKCDWCKKETLVKSPNKWKKIKEYNAKHFCSKKCKKEWYAKVWSQSEEWKEESRKRAVRILAEGKVEKVNSGCQLIINDILDELKINYINEYDCEYVAIDNYLPDYNLMIEVMGTYWHVDPRIYEKIHYQAQYDRVINDKRKKALIKSQYGINILYLWEEDALNNPELCKKLILEYISKKDKLVDYHSFNYSLVNDELVHENKYKAFMDYENEELQNLFEIKSGEKRSFKQKDKWIEFNCEHCGKETEQLKSRYRKAKNHFCSTRCAHDFKKGKSRSNYKKVTHFISFE